MPAILRSGKPSTLLIGLTFIAAYAQAQEFDPGRALYENHCQQCHAEWVHGRDRSRITRLSELRATVGAWSVHSGLSWGHEEIDLVTRYVNQRFYQMAE